MRTMSPFSYLRWFLQTCPPCAWGFALMLSLALIGCGPGVGGTGTGPVNENTVSAPAPGNNGAGNGSGTSPHPSNSVCQAAFAPLLSCAPPSQGTQAVEFADTPTEALVSASLAGDHLVLHLPCTDTTFEGDWAADSPPSGRFLGQLVTPPHGVPQPASVSAEPQDSQLVLRLFDTQGQALTEPLIVTRVPAPPSLPSRCPS